ncbi:MULTISPECIES: hypothetical protein [Olivibacter]|uniref:Uncharacterized protein n=1 Tax=Olivibacter jilunii TaxID=985016 RepID=A0ABW6B6S9_9SPHI|nr:hypothetical protein [Olivibacter sp. UJ_SKK_5.1]MDX3917323.1 hypothetical protein [Pseudosphingobacterium sp.]
MKKYLFLMIALVGLVGMSGCSKDDDPTFNPNRTFVMELPSSSWRSIDNGEAWEVEIPLDELTSEVFENDDVSVHLMFEDEIYEPLTTVYNGIAYRYDYAIGSILLDAKWADGRGGVMENRPPTRYVKIILSESW